MFRNLWRKCKLRYNVISLLRLDFCIKICAIFAPHITRSTQRSPVSVNFEWCVKSVNDNCVTAREMSHPLPNRSLKCYKNSRLVPVFGIFRPHSQFPSPRCYITRVCRIETISAIRMEQLGSQSTDFHEI